MAGKISQKDIEEVRARTNMVDVVGEYVQLKSAGSGEFKGRCPFHDEKSPSFTVSATKGFYHCFGCKVGGNLFDFVAAIESIGFPEVVERLASRLGMTLTYEAGGAGNAEHNSRARVLEANKAAADFYRAQFSTPDAAPGRELLASRGFDDAACEPFAIGWAPKGWSALTNHLKTLGFTDDEQVLAGLATKGDRGLFDKFRGRVIWPIRDATNAVVGFGARKIFEDDNGPKYLNTSETPVYHKSRVLYGIDLAKREISKQQQVVVVEGYTDVMACHLAGVTTAVATCGTAFGDEHIRQLNRILSDDPANPAAVIFNFDPDEAGQKAAMRAFNDASKFNAQTFMAIGPDGLDPSDLRTQRGDAAVVEMIANKKPLLEFAIGRSMSKFDLASREGQVGAARAAAVLLSQIQDSVMRSVYEKFVADSTSLDRSDIAALVADASKTQRKTAVAALRTSDPVEPAGVDVEQEVELNLNDPVTNAERWLLIALTQVPQACDMVSFARIGKTHFSSPWYKDIARAVYQVRASVGDQDLMQNVLDRLEPKLHATFRDVAMAQIPASDEEGREKFALGVLNRALEKTIEYEKNTLRQERRQADALGENEKVDEIDRQIAALDAEGHALRKSR
jgi:DNA primase